MDEAIQAHVAVNQPRGAVRAALEAIELRLERNTISDENDVRAIVAKWLPVARTLQGPDEDHLAIQLERDDALARYWLGDVAGGHAELMRLWTPVPDREERLQDRRRGRRSGGQARRRRDRRRGRLDLRRFDRRVARCRAFTVRMVTCGSSRPTSTVTSRCRMVPSVAAVSRSSAIAARSLWPSRIRSSSSSGRRGGSPARSRSAASTTRRRESLIEDPSDRPAASSSAWR